MTEYLVEYTIEVSRLVRVKAVDADQARRFVKDGIGAVEEATDTDSSLEIVSVEEDTP